MKNITLASRAARGRSRPLPASPMSRGGRFAEIFAYGDAYVQPIPDLASAAREIVRLHPGGADVILLGVSANQGMKITRDSLGFITVLIGLQRGTVEMFSDGDEVVVAFNQGAMRAGTVIGFLWEGGDAPDSAPPESNSASLKPTPHSIHRLLP
jgi:hypothetical protein